jgi:two-component system response regulator HydG
MHRSNRIEGQHSFAPEPPSNGKTIRWWGCSRAFRELTETLDRRAELPFPVLLIGESGTGKEGAARRLHDRSSRSRSPFIAVNVATLPRELAESELFGSERGAFTGADRARKGLFAQAGRGTLFLDEISDLDRTIQPKLLRVLQEGRCRPLGGTKEHEVRPRIITASHRDLAAEVRAGRFRADLFHRLSALPIRLPPLRDRVGDHELLADRMARRFAGESGLAYGGFCSAAIDRLIAHSWPGNLRELEWVVLRALLCADGRTIVADDLVFGPDLDPKNLSTPESAADPSVEPLEKTMILQSLRDHHGVKARAAREIGWTRQKLIRRLRHFNLNLQRDGNAETQRPPSSASVSRSCRKSSGESPFQSTVPSKSSSR